MNFLGLSVTQNISKKQLLEDILDNIFDQKDQIDCQLIMKDLSKAEKRIQKYWKNSEELRNEFSMYLLPKALLESIYRYVILDKEILTELASRVRNPEKTESKMYTAESERAYEVIQHFNSIIKHPKKIAINFGSEVIEMNNPDKFPVDRSIPETFDFDGKVWKVELKCPKIFFHTDFLEKDSFREEYLQKLENNKLFSNRLYIDFQKLYQLDDPEFNEENLSDKVFNDIEGLTYYLKYAEDQFHDDMYIGGSFEIIFKDLSKTKEEIHWDLAQFIPFAPTVKVNLIQNIHRLLQTI